MEVSAWTKGRSLCWRQVLLFAALWFMCVLVRAQEPSPSSLAEQRATNVTQVVLGILSYARWPVEPARLRLCILGPTEYTDDLIKGTTQATGRAVVVSRRLAADPHTADECDAVYIGALDSAQRSQLFSVLMGRPVLSISEADADCAVGSLFCLQVSDAHVGFAVNLDSVARSGVRIHPSVLQLSKRRAVQS